MDSSPPTERVLLRVEKRGSDCRVEAPDRWAAVVAVVVACQSITEDLGLPESIRAIAADFVVQMHRAIPGVIERLSRDLGGGSSS